MTDEKDVQNVAENEELETTPVQDGTDFDDNIAEILKSLENDFEEDEEDDEDESDEDGEEDSEESDADLETDDEGLAKGKTVPLIKAIKERKKRQAAEAELTALKVQLQELKSSSEEREIADLLQQKTEKYMKLGNNAETAKALAEDFIENYKLAKSAAKGSYEKVADKYDLEVAKLKTESAYYDNADAFTDKIREKMKKFEAIGEPLTAKQAYDLIVDRAQREKELANRAYVKGKETTAQPQTVQSQGSVAKKSKISKMDQEVLEILQKQDKNGKWTSEKLRQYLPK